MHLVDQRVLGVAILAVLAVVVVAKRLATGSFFRDRPEGGVQLWLTHIFNLTYLLLGVPLAAVLLIARSAEADPTHVTFSQPGLVRGLEAAGGLLYVLGCALMAWALVTLGRNYQEGGGSPRASDVMVLAGPYRLVRHPMYAAALSIALGLALLLQSLVYLGAFVVYLVLIAALIPVEEAALVLAYGERYATYRRQVKAIVPFVV